MKALVLAGGAGTRLRPFSYSMPKPLMPIVNKPVIVHIVETLRALAVKEVGIIVGAQANEIRAVLGDGSSLRVNISYIVQDVPRGLAHGVEMARGFLGDDDFIMYLGDNVLIGGVAEAAQEFRAERPAAQVILHKVAEPQAFGVAEIDSNGFVTRLVEKPADPRSDLAVIGVYFFTPAIHHAVAAIKPGIRGELEITDAIQWLINNGWKVKGRPHSGFWRDAGRVDDLLDCNREVLDGLRTSIAGEYDTASRISGPVVLEAGARLIRSRVVGPAIIGAGTVVRDSSVGPHTAIGRDCLLSQAVVEYSILLDGATVLQVKGIHGSVIGRGAIVGPSPDSGRHRLMVGDHCTIELAGSS